MITDYSALKSLPMDIKQDWHASLVHGEVASDGIFKLIHAERTDGASSLGQRVSVLVVDKDNHPIPLVKIAYAFDTANFFVVDDNFEWTPPQPQKAFFDKTNGGGESNMIQGSGVKEGQPGGITVYVYEPTYGTDIVFGAGMLSDHTGLYLVFKLFDK